MHHSAAPAFAHTPNAVQRTLIAITRRMPQHWLGRRIAYALRRIVINWVGTTPLDVETFGLNLRLYGWDNVAEKRLIYTPQYFDKEERFWLSHYLPQDGVFVDIGANAGGYTFYAAVNTSDKATILAVEPQPILCERLRYNLAQNGLTHVRLAQCALGDSDGEMTLYTYKKNYGEASLKPGMDHHQHDGSVQVPVMPLTTLLARENITHIDAMKLDAEGAEDSILTPFFRTAPSSLLPRMILLEYVPSRWQSDLRSLLEAHGYALDRSTHLNAIFVRK